MVFFRRWLSLPAVLLILTASISPSVLAHGPEWPPEAGMAMNRLENPEWPDLTDDLDEASLIRAIGLSRDFLTRTPADRKLRFGTDQYAAGHLAASLDLFKSYFLRHGPGAELRRLLARDFRLYRMGGEKGLGDVVCTGYYEPTLEGSLTRTDRFRHPLYRIPDDLAAGRPYYSRADIDRGGMLDGRGLEMAWVDDEVALFFLHIQGAGRIRLPDGRVLGVGYAGGNGRPYRSIGRHMMDNGWIPPDGMNIPAVRSWLRANPEKARQAMDHNESYVFFRFGERGALGHIDVPLTPGRSVALDDRLYPAGALAWLKTRGPRVDAGRLVGWAPSSRFVMVQDTGSAIRGAGRLDLFFGPGPEAEIGAGHMKESGELYFLVRK